MEILSIIVEIKTRCPNCRTEETIELEICQDEDLRAFIEGLYCAVCGGGYSL